MSMIGVDNWVEEAEIRTTRGRIATRLAPLERIPFPLRIVLLAGAASILPFATSSDYIVRVGVNTLLFVLLAIGLNVAVGWAGLLDLGYIALYGFGGYVYAWLDSGKFGIHLPAIASLPIVTCAGVLLGFILALPSRRLIGDYLAVVTLFFAQIFVILTTNANRITFPWNSGPTDVTGGPNGITGLDPLRVGSLQLSSIRSYYWFCLLLAAVVAIVLGLIERSRTGRAWKALREDPLAAELLGMPTAWLKLVAFAIGAGVASLSGSVFAAVQVGVFPQNFGVPLLITLYAMLILGGAGSLAGVAVGAVVFNVLLEVLRTPGQATWLFFSILVLGILRYGRPLRRMGTLVCATVAIGLSVFWVTRLVEPMWTKGHVPAAGLSVVLDHWTIYSPSGARLGQVALAGVLLLIVALAYLSGWWRVVLVSPLLYLSFVAWVNILVQNPSVTRLVLVGGILILLINVRPNGLLGDRRVEVV
jgi:branched-chain amino acid transport system permease protein